MKKIKNFNDYKQPLKTVFNLNWQSKNTVEQVNFERWTEEDRMRLVELALFNKNVFKSENGLDNIDVLAETFGRTEMSIQIMLGKIAIAILDGGSHYNKNI